MPWIAALIIGILSAFVNLWLSDRQRKSNEKNLNKQIDNSKEIAITQFKSTLSTKNRQEWLIELRNAISEAITHSRMIFLERNKRENRNSEAIIKYVEKFLNADAKIKLLLNDKNQNQKSVLDAVSKLLDAAIYDGKENKEFVENIYKNVIATSRQLFEYHWNKIKELN